MIYKYNVVRQKWNKLENVTLPHRLNYIGCVITYDERYIICTGGVGDEGSYAEGSHHKDLFVLDLKVMKVFECDLRLPFEGISRAIIMHQIKLIFLTTQNYRINVGSYIQ